MWPSLKRGGGWRYSQRRGAGGEVSCVPPPRGTKPMAVRSTNNGVSFSMHAHGHSHRRHLPLQWEYRSSPSFNFPLTTSHFFPCPAPPPSAPARIPLSLLSREISERRWPIS